MENGIQTNNTNRRSHILPKAHLESYQGQPIIKTLKDFQHEIEQVMVLKKVSFMDAVIEYCNSTGMELETAGSLIKSSAKLKARIQIDAEELHYLPRTSKLPI